MNINTDRFIIPKRYIYLFFAYYNANTVKNANSKHYRCVIKPFYFVLRLLGDKRSLRFLCAGFGWRTFFIASAKRTYQDYIFL